MGQDRKCHLRMATDPDKEKPPEEETEEGTDRWAVQIPRTRMGRSAKLGSAIGTQATRYAGTMAANVARSADRSAERMESRHLESALKLASVLGEMKGAAMKIGQMASFIDIDFLPPEYREIYQDNLAKLRTNAPPMPWESVVQVLEEEYGQSPDRLFSSIEEEAFAAASIGQVHRATLRDGTPVAVKIQYPGIADALESDLANAGILVRLSKVLAPGLDAKAVASELRERVLEELDYEYEAQNQRAFATRTMIPAFAMSDSRASATPGYWTLTATLLPSCRVARWTWPIEAAANASGSISANTLSGALPSYSETSTSRTFSQGIAGAWARSFASCSW